MENLENVQPDEVKQTTEIEPLPRGYEDDDEEVEDFFWGWYVAERK
jgi:hypothetical protein